MGSLVRAWFALAVCLTVPGQGPTPEQQAATTIKTVAQEVLLDVVVRDKKGKPVRDLKPEEIEVLDNGEAVGIKSFRLVEGARVVPSAAAAPTPATPAAEATPALDPLRQIRLVSLVFERLGVDGRRLFKQAALDILKSAPEQNLYFAVFSIDQTLRLLQPFTNDRTLLKWAIERAEKGAYSQFVSQSEAVQKQLEEASTLEDSAAAAATSAGSSRGEGSGSVGQAQAQAALAQIQLRMLQFAENMQRDQKARSSIFSLLGLVKEQGRLPGRKMVLYFTEDFQASSGTAEQFRSFLSAANRANVSIYPVDARGLVTQAQNLEGDRLIGSAAGASRARQLERQHDSDQAGAIKPDEAKVFDTVQTALYSNVQAGLAEMAGSTGGFLIANTNDIRSPLRKAVEELTAYYEISYTPAIVNYDGHFRPIVVSVRRPEVTVQTRNGYYALPPLNDAPLFPFEIPLLDALARNPLPRVFDYRAGVQRFDPRGREVEYSVTIDVPLKDLVFVADKANGVYKVHASLIVFFKNARGEIVAKMSRDFPYSGPLDRMEAFQRGNLIQTYHLKLAAGRYSLETAVADRNAQTVSARKAVIMTPPAGRGLAISDLVLIRRIDPLEQETDAADPLHFEGGRITPTLFDSVEGGEGRSFGFYFVVYPDAGDPAAPELRLEFLRDGRPVGQATPALPKPDKNGKIAYLTTMPGENFPPGDYQMRAIVRQGAAVTQEEKFFTVQ